MSNLAPDADLDIGQLLQFALEKEASDLIVTAGSPPAFRINGELRFLSGARLSPEASRRLVYAALTDEQIAKFESRHELDFSLTIEQSVRFRGNVFMQRGAVGAAFRLIPSKIPTLQDLNLPPIFEEFALQHQGLIVITGPTGHGKSTTQAAMIDLINTKRRCHIVTIEDPIEFVHTNRGCVIEQREVGMDTEGFGVALRHVLRQDPDVILIGEMRDVETMAAALTAAETGHLVLSTLHTNDTVQAIDRILDSFPAHQQNQVRMQLAFCLLAGIAQRLLPRADGKGRVAAIEVMRNNHAVSNLIREEKTQSIYTVLETHAKEGMMTMDSSIKELYLRGVITREVARRRMRDPSTLDRGGARGATGPGAAPQPPVQ
ncbi:MAG TPA: PilT/PilU family type 4a pilus ATPase [Candidatus Brocadiia bacterium]|nr:PilT/PilU family type 4a pilus ATPase [Candidatus Brocadiia bacterium]